MGVGQRLAKYATHVGGVINVTNSNLTQKILTKIYKDLDYEWIPTTVGSIENEIGKITNSEMISALIKKFSEYYFFEETTLDQNILDKAHKIEDNYSVKNSGKRLKELALMEQPFIRDSSMTVTELVKQVAGQIGENVKVRRFTRYTLGEGIEKNQMDFAEEVASMQSN